MRKLGALVALVLAGCGDSGPSTPTAVPQPGVAFLVVAIPPPNATPSPDPAFAWAANFTVNLAEQGGVAVDLTSITVELDEPVVFDETFIRLGAQTTHIVAGGTLSVRLSMAFEEAALNAKVAVRGVDTNGNDIEAFGRLVVIPAQRP